MKRVLLWVGCFVLLCLAPLAAAAATWEVRPGVEIELPALPQPWQVSEEPPEFLVEERAAQLHEPQLAAARRAGIDSPAEAARQMLRANELFVFNPDSGAHLEIDFSPLKGEDKAPTARALKNSARYAAEGLQSEEGIEAVETKVGKTAIVGAEAAYRIDAEFISHGEAKHFVGVITFARNHWIYLYFTGPRSNPQDLATIDALFRKMNLAPAGQ